MRLGRVRIPIWGGGGIAPGEAKVVDVTKGAAVRESAALWVSPDSYGLYKTGEGKYTVPIGAFVNKSVQNLGAANGELELDLDDVATPETARPEEILSRAALWFDASAEGTVIFDKDGTSVNTWLDVRENVEQAKAGTYSRPRAVSQTNHYPENPRKPTFSDVDGRKAINFGLTHDGRYMVWLKPDGSTNDVNGIMHFYAVHGVVNTWGYLLGSVDKVAGDISDAYNGSKDGVLWAWEAPQSRARNFINGTRVDGYTQKPLTGFQLLELAYGNTRVHDQALNCFFNDRNYQEDSSGSPMKKVGKRVGGDYLSEVLVFTGKLTEEERLAVETYLLRKWRLVDGYKDLRTATSGNSSLALSRSSDADGGDVMIHGNGTIKKTGSADLYIQPGVGKSTVASVLPVTPNGRYRDAIRAMTATNNPAPFNGRLKIAKGTAFVNTPVALSLDAKDVVNAAIVVKGGNKVSIANTGADGEIRKTGGGLVVVDGLGEDVGNIAVDAGTLVLKAPAKSAPERKLPIAAGTAVAIPNPGFETVEDGVDFMSGQCYYEFSNGSYCGWTAAGTTAWDSYVYISGRKSDTEGGTYKGYGFDLPPPHTGNGQLAIQYKKSAYAAIDLPADGEYEIVFWLGGSGWEWDKYLTFEVAIEDAQGKETTVGKFVRPIGTKAYREVRFKTPRLAGGAGQKLWFKNTNNLQTAIVIDDVSMTLLPDVADESIVELPNGDLEDYTLVYAKKEYAEDAKNNTATGWGVAQPEGWTSGKPRVAIIGRGTTDYMDVFTYDRGEAMLCFRDVNGKATLKNVTLPAGTYKLAGKLALRRIQGDMGSTGTATLSASVTVAGGETVFDLGSVAHKRRLTTNVEWPNAFTLEEETMVDIALTQTTATILLADDFCLKRVGNGNLLADGGLETVSESTSAWKIDKGTFNSYVQRYSVKDGMNDYFNQALFEGQYYCVINNDAAIFQTVNLAKAGRYRLTIHQHARKHADDSGYKNNPIAAIITGEDGVSRQIGKTATKSDDDVSGEFIRYDFDFAVATPGDYTITLKGTRAKATSDQYLDANSILDDISLVAIDEESEESAPQISKETSLAVAAGAKVRLDYGGVLELRSLKLGSTTYRHGTFNADTAGDYFYGTGTIYIKDRGTRVIIR